MNDVTIKVSEIIDSFIKISEVYYIKDDIYAGIVQQLRSKLPSVLKKHGKMIGDNKVIIQPNLIPDAIMDALSSIELWQRIEPRLMKSINNQLISLYDTMTQFRLKSPKNATGLTERHPVLCKYASVVTEFSNGKVYPLSLKEFGSFMYEIMKDDVYPVTYSPVMNTLSKRQKLLDRFTKFSKFKIGPELRYFYITYGDVRVDKKAYRTIRLNPDTTGTVVSWVDYIKRDKTVSKIILPNYMVIDECTLDKSDYNIIDSYDNIYLLSVNPNSVEIIPYKLKLFEYLQLRIVTTLMNGKYLA